MSSYLCVQLYNGFPSYCLHVKRVERLHYVHNIDPFDVMSKGLNTNIDTFNAMSKGLKQYVHNIDTFNAMSKDLKDYIIYTI